ncbi:hypothetical protein [Hymenobacter jeollabukensis]|uniref:Uncharacterized protein n=1 Tax=Hymenobacter jeollabukensis TaxID=2025313 RepID=A0A5R8WJF5_9BACT|nr:hypothetical protein [Hymenobacter jeollabukensis]TLM88866.1 hypothetical protein FDY95_22045 [Hymenobacter jeollabukensis]
MESTEYRESLQQAATALVGIRGQLFDLVFQVAITGELKEWADSIAVGEQVTFSKEMFAGCEDTNVRLLTQLLTGVEQTCDSLLNLNNLHLGDD